MGKKLPTISDGLWSLVCIDGYLVGVHQNLHIVIIPSDGERKTAGNPIIGRIGIGTLEGAACEHCFLGIVKCNGAKLLPVANKLVFDDNFVDRELALNQNCQSNFIDTD